MKSPDAITPVAPARKARRRTLTLERPESRVRARAREDAKSLTDSESSGNEVDDEGEQMSKGSSNTSQHITENSSVPRLDVSEVATSPIITPPSPTIPRPSISTVPPRYMLRKAFKRIKLQNPLPPIMILHLKRFYGTYTGAMKKIDDFVSFETEFDFAPFVFPPIPKESKLLYRLTGVVVHLGSINSGQYFPFVTLHSDRSYVSYFYTHKTLPLEQDEELGKKGPLATLENNSSPAEPGQSRREWVYASDTAVRAASKDEVLRARAYLLVYEKI
jgi:Ubiquitin carboxyl-terminal hydrolase